MNHYNDFFARMCKEATEELASGEKGTNWKDAATNTLLLACFGMLYNHLSSRIVKPLWFFASSVLVAVIWVITSTLLEL